MGNEFVYTSPGTTTPGRKDLVSWRGWAAGVERAMRILETGKEEGTRAAGFTVIELCFILTLLVVAASPLPASSTVCAQPAPQRRGVAVGIRHPLRLGGSASRVARLPQL